jgi:hypothetical protein
VEGGTGGGSQGGAGYGVNQRIAFSVQGRPLTHSICLPLVLLRFTARGLFGKLAGCAFFFWL